MSFRRVKEKLPYHGKGVDELIATLRRILTEFPKTQKVTLEVGVPFIRIERAVPEDAEPEIRLSHHDAIRACKMEEYKPEQALTSLQQLHEIFHIILQEGLEVGFILASDKYAFQEWLKIRIPNNRMRVFGVPLVISTELPEDVFVVCGTPEQEAEADDIQFSVKGVLL